MGKMWWIPCSDWLPGLQTGPSCPLEIARDRSPWSRAGKRSRWMDLQGWQLFHNVGDGVGRKRRTKKTLNNSYGFIVFETNESFLILITSKSFCFLINPLVTKLFRSRWLDITLVFFFFFLRCQCPAILISCMCTASLDQCCCLSNCAPSPSLPWPNNSQLITM